MAYLIVIIAALAASFFLGVLVGRRGSAAANAAAFLGLVVLFAQVGINLYPEIEVAVFNFTDYIYFRWWGVPGAFLLIGAGLERMEERNRRALAGFMVFSATAIVYFWYQVMFGVAVDFKQIGFVRGICMQTTDYTCAPAACATMLAGFGVRTTEKEMTVLCATQTIGTGYVNIMRGLRLRLAAEKYEPRLARFSWDGLKAVPKPFVAKIVLSAVVDHMVAVLEVGTDSVLLGDPYNGRRTMKKDEFEKKWDGLAAYLEAKR